MIPHQQNPMCVYIYIYVLFSCVPGNGSLWQKSFLFGGLDIAMVRGHCQGGNYVVVPRVFLVTCLAAVRLQKHTFPEQKWSVGPYSTIMHYIGRIIYFCILIILTIWDSKEIPRCSIQRSLHSKIGIWILQDLLLPRSQDTSRPNVGTRFCIHTVHRFPPKPDVWKTKKINLDLLDK